MGTLGKVLSRVNYELWREVWILMLDVFVVPRREIIIPRRGTMNYYGQNKTIRRQIANDSPL